MLKLIDRLYFEKIRWQKQPPEKSLDLIFPFKMQALDQK